MSGDSRKVLSLSSGWRIRLKRGVRALREGHERLAAQAFEDALQQAPDEPAVLRAIGRARSRAGQHAQAVQFLHRAWQLQPTSAPTAAVLARTLGIHLHQHQAALLVLEEARSAIPSSAMLDVVYGELLLEVGNYRQARQAFERAATRRAHTPSVMSGLSRSYNAEGIELSESGQLEPAIFAFKRAADLDADWSAPYVNLGVVFGRLGNLSKAVDAYQQALQRDPQNPAAYFNLGRTQHALGELVGAARIAEELLRICPDYPQARTSLADTLVDLGEFDRAIALLLEDLDRGHASSHLWCTLALAYICSGSADRGEDCFRSALAIDPTCFSAHYNLAVLYATEQRHSDAEAALRQAFEINPQRARSALRADPGSTGLQRMERLSFLHQS